MKIKYTALLIFLISFFTPGLFCQENFHLDAGAVFKIRNGRLNEFVYNNSTDNTNKLSELNWDVENIFYLGGNVNLEYKNIFVSLESAGAVPSQSNDMQDSDWQNADAPSMKTNYSVSENRLSNSYYLDFNFFYRIPLAKVFSLRALFNFNFENFSFYAENGYGGYGDTGTTGNPVAVPWNSSSAVKFKKGELGSISYERKSYNTSIGISPCFYVKDFLEINLFGAVSPFVYLESVDTHYSVDKSSYSKYLDKGSAFFNSWNAGLNVKYSPVKHFSVLTNLKYSQINFYKANTYGDSNKNGYYDKSSSLAGFDQHYWDFSLGFIYRPF